MSKKDGGPALSGMNMRQWYKGMAMIGMLDHGWNPDSNFSYFVETCAKLATAQMAEDEEFEKKSGVD